MDGPCRTNYSNYDRLPHPSEGNVTEPGMLSLLQKLDCKTSELVLIVILTFYCNAHRAYCRLLQQGFCITLPTLSIANFE